MIVRAWLLFGLVLIVGAIVLQVPLAPPPFQLTARSALDGYREAGLMPAPGALKMSKEIGHEVFEVPEEDAEHLEEAQAEGMTSMPGMAMGEMKEAEHDEAPMEGMAMGEMKEAEHDEAPMEGMAMGEMKEAEHAEAPMEGMAMGEMKKAEHAEAPMEGMAMGEMKEAGPAEAPMEGMAMGEMEEGGHGGGGLMVMPVKMAGMAARTIEIEMREWGFSPPSITVKAGEVIHFKVRNRGSMPHEFMFMPPAGMAAVNYRIGRADWNLTEHEASFEHALVLPGDGFETVIEIAQPGVWMFMCMFPYHMQLGMMGMMMTEGASMDGMNMGGMGGMKM